MTSSTTITPLFCSLSGRLLRQESLKLEPPPVPPGSKTKTTLLLSAKVNVLYSVQASPYKPFAVCPPTDRGVRSAEARRSEAELGPSQSSDSERCAGAGSGGIQAKRLSTGRPPTPKRTTKHLATRLSRTFEIKMSKEAGQRPMKWVKVTP